jgi:hypothetical protein
LKDFIISDFWTVFVLDSLDDDETEKSNAGELPFFIFVSYTENQTFSLMIAEFSS